ncbi:MAG: RluA family pseudouridine synthase [Deltaproteobacteria bacterium]|nr:RluA family pseudouridine synthase [Deltaproteobacteria bacterium]
MKVGRRNVGQRLDKFLSVCSDGQLAGISRAMFQGIIRAQRVSVDNLPQKAGYRLRLNDSIIVSVPPPEAVDLIPEDIDLEILYEDEDLIVISKQPGLVVHPACGHYTGTLVHGLLFHCRDLSGINGEIRPGIVHRLDKDTSGVMVAAKKDSAHLALAAQFKGKEVSKTYKALLDGVIAPPAGRLATRIGRHPVHRKKMAVVERGGKEAVTSWQTLEVFKGPFTLAAIQLETGRTHQIRVHTAHLGTPVAGDPVYGRKNILYHKLGITRQLLHAWRLTFIHPRTGERMTFTAPMPADMVSVINELEAG